MSTNGELLETSKVLERVGVTRNILRRWAASGAVKPDVRERKSGGRTKWSVPNVERIARLAAVWRLLSPLMPGTGRRGDLPSIPGRDIPLANRIAIALPRCPAGGVLIISQSGVRASAGKETLREAARKAAGPIVVVSAP